VTPSQRHRAIARDLRDELSAIDRSIADMAEARASVSEGEAPSRIALWACGGTLHAFYTGIERVLQIVAETIDGGLPAGSDWHRRLLRQMVADRPGLRPPVLTVEAAASLDEYLAFRHRYRNLYLFDLRWEPIRTLLDRVPDVWRRVRSELEALARFLDAMTGTE
jgi:hypothetical protein